MYRAGFGPVANASKYAFPRCSLVVFSAAISSKRRSAPPRRTAQHCAIRTKVGALAWIGFRKPCPEIAVLILSDQLFFDPHEVSMANLALVEQLLCVNECRF